MHYIIARLDDDGEWETLDHYMSYKDADAAYDEYADKFPFVPIEIIEVAN